MIALAIFPFTIIPATHKDASHVRTAELAGELASDRDRDIVVYCASTTCRNSHIAAAQLERMGYRNVRVYGAGKQDWIEAGLPTETGGQAR